MQVNITQFQQTTWCTKQQCWKLYKHTTSYLQNKSQYFGLASWYKKYPSPYKIQ